MRLSAGEQLLPVMLTILDDGKEEISSPPSERSPLNVRQGGAGYLWYQGGETLAVVISG